MTLKDQIALGVQRQVDDAKKELEKRFPDNDITDKDKQFIVGMVGTAYLNGISQTVDYLQKMDGAVTLNDMQRAVVKLGEEIGLSYGQPEQLTVEEVPQTDLKTVFTKED